MSWYHSDEDPNLDPWSSIVDLMSAFALVLFLALTFFIINFGRSKEELKQRQQLLETKQKELRQTMVTLRTKTTSLETVTRAKSLLIGEKDRLAEQNSLIQEQLRMLKIQEEKSKQERKKLIAEREKLLGMKRRLLNDKKALADEVGKKSQVVLKIQQATKEQEKLLAQVQVSRSQCENKLKSLVEQRKQILNSLAQAFTLSKQSSKLKSIGFDPRSGKFRLGGQVLFTEGSPTLREGGKKQLLFVLNTLFPVITGSKRKLISGVMIEGHTSATGSETHNWTLSSQRALAATHYLLSVIRTSKPNMYPKLAPLFIAAGLGQHRPVLGSDGQPSARLSRRIEIKLLFGQHKKLQKILKGVSSR